MMQIYRLFYLIAKVTIIVLKPFLSQRTKTWVQLRSALLSNRYQKLQIKNSILVHASSGEIEYAKTLIRELKKKYPDVPIVVTFSSESAEKLFGNIQSYVDLFIPLPWDDAYSIKLLFKKINPQIIVIARTDLWPELIWQSARYGIPLVLISYFPKITPYNRLYLRSLLKKFSLVSCVDDDVKIQIESMGLGPSVSITADGDTRFDQVFARLEQSSQFRISSRNKIFTFGSTWTEDEVQLFPLMSAILKSRQHIILCPHDVSAENLKRIETQMMQKGFKWRRFSEFSGEEINFDFPILLVDRIGVLADTYRYSDYVFVGGSFKSRVHSVMEPLACGVPVFVGPKIQNSPEALKYAKFNNYVIVNQDGQELIKNHKRLTETDLKSLSLEIRTEMQKNLGASKKISQFISDNFLKN